MTIRMISTKPHLYAGRRLRAGDEFDARGKRDMRLLEALGRARRVHADVITQPVRPEPLFVPAPVEITDVVVAATEEVELTATEADEPAAEEAPAEEVPEAEISPRTGKPKRQYRRRDMTAED